MRNRFKGLDLIDRAPDELWMEVHNIVQETGIKTISMEKKCKKAKWLSGEALQIAVKRREAKSKGAKERYKHLNAEFQRIARRGKKALLSDQCKEIEGNKRMEKTRDLFKKIRDTKGTFHAKMGTIKERNGIDLTEAEYIKKRLQHTQKNYTKKDLHDPDNHDSVITHLEPDILDGEVKDMMLSKCCTQYAIKFGKLSSGHRTRKGQFSFQYQRKAMPKNAQTTTQLHSSHILVK